MLRDPAGEARLQWGNFSYETFNEVYPDPGPLFHADVFRPAAFPAARAYHRDESALHHRRYPHCNWGVSFSGGRLPLDLRGVRSEHGSTRSGLLPLMRSILPSQSHHLNLTSTVHTRRARR